MLHCSKSKARHTAFREGGNLALETLTGFMKGFALKFLD
jgi:hypothetical protein